MLRLFLISPDGHNAREIKCPIPGGELSAPTWINGTQVIYVTPESLGDTGLLQATLIGSSGRVLLQDIKNGNTRTLFTVGAPASRIEVAGAGRLIFDSLAQRDNLKIFPGPGADARWLTRGNSIDREPFFSPDGASVVFASSRAGDVDIWELSLKTAALRRLTDHPALDWDPFVTTDNQHLLWSSARSGNFEIWISDRDGSSPRQLTHDGVDAENPVATSDGWVLYVSGRRQQPGVWKVRLDGSDAQVFVPGSVAWPEVSPDGKYALYHTISGALEGTIHVVHFPDGTPVDFKAEGQRARFSADGNSIVYIRSGGGDIVKQNFLSGPNSTIQVLVPASPDFITETFAIPREGKHMVVSYMQPSRSLMIANGVSGISAATKPQ